MQPIYKVEVDPAEPVVRHYLAGFFEEADVARYRAARDAAHRRLTCAPNAHVTLVDIRDMKIQQQEVVAAFAAMMGEPQHRSRKLAFVVAQSLARLQLLRAIANRGARCFTSIEDAEAWLLADDDGDEAPGLDSVARKEGEG